MTKADQCGHQKNKTRTTVIRKLNDQLRQTLVGGHVHFTSGLLALGSDAVEHVINAVRRFSDFTEGNDPYGEHDFGAIEAGGGRVFWKIDYYDQHLEAGSPDPADPSVTTRVLTVMLASEY